MDPYVGFAVVVVANGVVDGDGHSGEGRGGGGRDSMVMAIVVVREGSSSSVIVDLPSFSLPSLSSSVFASPKIRAVPST